MSIEGVGQNSISWLNLQTEFDAQLEAINNSPETATLTVSDKQNLALDRAVQKLTLEAPSNPNPTEKQLNDVTEKMGNIDSATAGDITTLMYLFHEMTVLNRQTARQERATQRDQQIGQLGKAADEIRKAAKSAFISGMVMAAVSTAGGMMSVAGGLKSASAMKNTTSATGGPAAQQNLKTAQTNAASAADDVKVQQANVKTATQTKIDADDAVSSAQKNLDTKQAQLTELKKNNAPKTEIEAQELEVNKATKDLQAAKDTQVQANQNLKQAKMDLADAEETSRIATKDFDTQMKKSKLTPEQKEETLLHKDKDTIDKQAAQHQRDVDAQIQKSQRFTNYAQGASSIAQGGGQGAAAQFNAEQKGHEATQKDHEINATKSETLAKDADDTMQSLRDLEREIRDKLNQILTAKMETNRKIMA